MIARAYIVDEALFSLFFLALAVLFLLQLLVEQKANFDEKQLTANQRLRTWETKDRRVSNPINSGALSPTRDNDLALDAASSLPRIDGARHSLPGTTGHLSPDSAPAKSNHSSNPSSGGQSSDRGTDEISTDSFPSNEEQGSHKGRDSKVDHSPLPAGSPVKHATENAEAEVSQRNGKQKRMKVGVIQWYFHRLGMIICVLELVRMVDPYGIHGIYPFYIVSFLHHNAVALIFSAAVMGHFFPLRLIKRITFRQDSRFLAGLYWFIVATAVVLANIIPIVFATKDYPKAPKTVFNLYVIIALAVTVIVYNVYVRQVIATLNELIEYRAKTLVIVQQTSQPPSARPSVINSPSLPNSDRLNKSLASFVPTGTPHTETLPSPQPDLELARMDTSTAIPGRLYSDTTLEQVRVDEPLKARDHSEPHALTASPTVSTDSIPSAGTSGTDSNLPSASTSPKLTSETRHLESTTSQQPFFLPSAARDSSYNPAKSGSARSSLIEGGDISPRAQGKADGSSAALISNNNNNNNNAQRAQLKAAKRDDSVAKEYRKVVRNLRRFRIATNCLSLCVVVWLVIGRSDYTDADPYVHLPEPDSYSNASNVLFATLLTCAGLLIVFWYSYMPMRECLRASFLKSRG